MFLATGDEVIAFTLLQKCMFDLNWRGIYKDQLYMLVTLTKKVTTWLGKEHPQLARHLENAGVTLEAQLSSPLMGLFANLCSLEQCLRVLDRFVLFGEDGVLNVVKSTFVSQKHVLLGFKDPFELQVYLTRQIYLDAINNENFLPKHRDFIRRKSK